MEELGNGIRSWRSWLSSQNKPDTTADNKCEVLYWQVAGGLFPNQIKFYFMNFVLLIILLISIIFKCFPPKKINSIYGYRTHRSMKNITAWNVANKFSSTLMIVFFSALCLISFVLELLSIPYNLIVLLVLITAAFTLIIILTEKKLKSVN